MFTLRYSIMSKNINFAIAIILFLFNFHGTKGTNLQGHECTKNEFQCTQSLKCIPLEKRCDGIFADCAVYKPDVIIDQSDEKDCPCNELTQYRCDDGSCIPIAKRCDRWPDCRDLSDERSCSKKCTSSEFHCIREQNCLSIEKKCNGIKDCQDGSDEINCFNLNSHQSNISYQSLITNNTAKHLNEPLENSPVSDQASTPFPQIGASTHLYRVKKSSNSEEANQRCSEEHINNLRAFFSNMYFETTKLSKTRQLRVKKIMFDIVLEMEMEEAKKHIS